MSSEKILRERQLWIAAVAVLVTGAAWLALVNAALLIRTVAPDLSGYVVTLRVLMRTIPTLFSLAAPFVAAAAAAALVIGWIALSGLEANARQEGARRV